MTVSGLSVQSHLQRPCFHTRRLRALGHGHVFWGPRSTRSGGVLSWRLCRVGDRGRPLAGASGRPCPTRNVTVNEPGAPGALPPQGAAVASSPPLPPSIRAQHSWDLVPDPPPQRVQSPGRGQGGREEAFTLTERRRGAPTRGAPTSRQAVRRACADVPALGLTLKAGSTTDRQVQVPQPVTRPCWG